jgi:hypothetical protein
MAGKNAISKIMVWRRWFASRIRIIDGTGARWMDFELLVQPLMSFELAALGRVVVNRVSSYNCRFNSNVLMPC